MKIRRPNQFRVFCCWPLDIVLTPFRGTKRSSNIDFLQAQCSTWTDRTFVLWNGQVLEERKCEPNIELRCMGKTLYELSSNPDSVKWSLKLHRINAVHIDRLQFISLCYKLFLARVFSESAMFLFYKFSWQRPSVTNEQGNDWFKYVELDTFCHNTFYHSAFVCSPAGVDQKKTINLRFNNTFIEWFSPNSEYVIALQDAMSEKVAETQLKLTEMYSKYRAFCDCKWEANLLAHFSDCLLLNSKLMTQPNCCDKLIK